MRVRGKRFDTGEVVTLTLAGGRISGSSREAGAADLGGDDLWLAPAFLDLQVNGYGGYDFNLGAWGAEGEVSSELAPIFDLLARSGTASFCPTITTNSREAILEGLRAIAELTEQDRSLRHAVAGIHLEGPYIAAEDGPRGAHPLEHVRDPSWEEFQAFQDAAGGQIRIITLAPERPGALRFIEQLSEAGVVVALGHSGADPAVIQDAVLAGARMSTHLGNGSHAVLPRHSNYLWEQLACDGLHASIIADGHHLPPSVLQTFVRTKGPERLALISDAISLGGLPPGLYANDVREVLPSGKVVVAGTPYLSGAGHLLDTCIAHAVRTTDLTLAQAVRCATEVPARLLGRVDRGELRVGTAADLVLFRLPDTGPLEIEATVRAGEIIHSVKR